MSAPLLEIQDVSKTFRRSRSETVHAVRSVSLAVSAGQELVTTAADYLDFALRMPTTKVVGLFLEAIRNPAGFVAALELANARDIPVIVLKVGRSPESAEGFASGLDLDAVAAETLSERVAACGAAESLGLIRALAGRFVPPGPAGAPARGRRSAPTDSRTFMSISAGLRPS